MVGVSVRGRPGLARLLALLALSVCVVSSPGASAATPPAGSPATLHYAKSGKSSRSCSYYQEDTPAPIGDHRYAMNNTCDNGIQHWFKIGSNWNLQGHKQYPYSRSDPACFKINEDAGRTKVAEIGGSCDYVVDDLLPAINPWGTIVF